MASDMFDNARLLAVTGALNWTGTDFWVMLVDNTYSQVKGDVYVADGAAAKELTGASYTANGTAGRINLANLATAIASNRAQCKADNVTWSALTGQTVGGAVVYKKVTNDADSLVLCFVDLSDVATTGLDLTIKWNAAATNGAIFSF